MIPVPFLAIAIIAAQAQAPAPAFDGSQNLICAVTEMQQCSAGDGCSAVAVADSNMPRFVRFDFKKNTISGRRPDGTEVNTPITAQKKLADSLVLQGTEGLYGWSVSLGAGGEFGVTLSAPEFSSMAFGACTPD